MFSYIKKHYHWIIAFVMLLQLAIIGGITNNYSGLFLLPITADLEINRSTFSLVYTLKYLFSFIFILLSGPIFMRLGNKKAVITGLLFSAGGYAILPLSTNVLPLAIGNMCLGFGEALCCTAAVSRVISAWFHRYKGLVWGIVSSSTGVSGSLLCILLSNVITGSSWRSAYLLSSGIVITLTILVFLLVKGNPEEIGLSPFGMHDIPKAEKPAPVTRWAGYSMGELRKKPYFYLALVSVFLSSFAIYMPYDIIVPHIQDRGHSLEEAVAMQSAMLIYLTASKLIAGFLSDKLGAKTVTIGCTAFGTASLLLLSKVSDSTGISAAILFYALALPVPTVLIPLLTVKLFGYQAQSTYHGIFMALPLLGLLIATPSANAVFDYYHSYSPILLIGAILSATSILLYLITYWLAFNDQKRTESI